MTKKLLSFLLLGLFVLSLAGCGLLFPNKPTEGPTTQPTTQPSSQPTTAPTTVPGVERTIDFELEETGGQTEYSLDPTVLPNRPTKNPDASYTYNLASNSLPTAWNIHTYQSNASTLVLDYCEDSFYTFDFNEELNGYRILPAMASQMPVDVTEDYVGDTWGIAQGDKGKAYKVTLRHDLKFEDGTPIKAVDFVESVKWLLNPQAANYRADSVYSGSFKIVNAENYFKGGTYAYGPFVSADYGDDEYVYPTDWTYSEEGILQCNGKDVAIKVGTLGNWSPSATYGLERFAQAGYFGQPRTVVTVGEGEEAQEFVKYASKDLETVVWRTMDLLNTTLTVGEGDDAIQYVLYTNQAGEAIAWRSLEKDGEGDDADYVWYVDNEGALGAEVVVVTENNSFFVTIEEEEVQIYLFSDYVWYADDEGQPDLDNEVVVTDKPDSYYLGDPDEDDDAVAIAWANCPDPESVYAILLSSQDAKGYIQLTEELVKMVQDCVAILHGFADVEAYAADSGDYAYVEFEEMAFLGSTYEVVDFETVGIKVDPEDEYSIIFILEKELTGFYLNYSLCTSMYLVDTTLYESLIGESQGVYTNSYGTSVDTYKSFGPYKLTYFLKDSQITMEKNAQWYGYTLEENANNYWTTKIVVKQVEKASDRLNMFLRGSTDSYGLQAEDMNDYQSSDYTYYTEGDSTWFVAINPDFAAYESMQADAEPVTPGNKVYKTILAYKEFRMALSFSLDRANYALTLDPLGGVAKAVYGNMIISDPENGTAYRTTEQAKDVILKFWDLADEVGEDGIYETKEEAIESITGYDLAGSKTLFEEAYNKWVADGCISAQDIESGNWEIQIMIGQPGSGSSSYYNDGYVYLGRVWADAVTGTPLEGHLTFKQSAPLGSTDFSKYLKNNTVDLLFGVGWTGSALDPYGLMEAYVAPNYQYDPAWDTASTMLDIEIGGYTLRASVFDWGKSALSGDTIKALIVEDGVLTNDYVMIHCGTTCKPEIRLDVLAAVEGAVLEQYDMIPTLLDASATLKGMKIKYGVEEYVFGVGRGGIKYMTFNYTDDEWAQYIANSDNLVDGVLPYKK